MRIIVGISGASGTVYGHRLLEKLRARGDVETHLVMTRSGERTAWLEMGLAPADFRALADQYYSIDNIGAPLASGSFLAAGMVVAPCSVHSMSAIACGLSSNLLVRAADVCLKERRRLVLMVRESPFHAGHLRTMLALTEMGAIVAPPAPAFYTKPQTAMDIVDFTVDRVLDLLGLPGAQTARWDGLRAVAGTATPEPDEP
ncbi:MAG TPA: UbiX family flavin prenyltransferase [Bryobacteraceae bacterium]|nr:UbiX family flavin prenyltransferase [Bryobacteraceae bacterium]